MFDSKYENMMKSLLTESKKLNESSTIGEAEDLIKDYLNYALTGNGSLLDTAKEAKEELTTKFGTEMTKAIEKYSESDEYAEFSIDDLTGLIIKEYERRTSKISESKQLKEDINSLEEPAGEEDEDMEGEAEGVVVVVDPDLTSDDYEKAIQNAEDTIDETPEGEQPTDEQYIGQNIYTCPVCGNTFFSEVELDEGDACPVCSEVPESFVLNGKVEGDITEEDEELADELENNMEEEEVPAEEIETTEEVVEEPAEEEEEVKGESLKAEVKKGTNVKTERKATVLGFDASELHSINENYRNVAEKYWFDYKGEPICLKIEAKVLDEKANPENAEANKKIRDVLLKGPNSKYYQDVLDMGYEVTPDKYDENNYAISNPNKPAYQSNYSSRSSDLATYYGGNRTVDTGKIRRMKASKSKQIDYKNYLDKDYSPRSTGRRIQYGGKNDPGDHFESGYVNKNIHDIPTYDEYNQDTFNTEHTQAGSPNMRAFRNAKARMRAYEDPNYNSFRDTNYKHADVYNVSSKDGLDQGVSRAEQDLADFEAGLEAQRQKYKDNIAKARQKRDAGAADYQANKDTVDRLLKRK